MGTHQYAYVYDPIGHQKSAKPKAQPPGDRDFEAVRTHGARSRNPRRSGTCNRTAATNDGVSSAYAANGLNQYTNLQSAAYSLQPSYDADGNMTSYGSWTYTWDAENRLISATSNNLLLVINVYDHQSRRIRKEVHVREFPSFEFQVSRSHAFLYDGCNPVREVQHSTLPTFHFSTNYYTWGPDLSGTMQGAGGVGGLLAVSTAAADSLTLEPLAMGTSYPCYDANGNVTAYLDESGAIVAGFEYDAFGNTVSDTWNLSPETCHLPFRFSTKYLDEETGLYYYGYRFYEPELMRFLNRDPIQEEGGLNLYGFVANGPVNRWDLLGLDFIDWVPIFGTLKTQIENWFNSIPGQHPWEYPGSVTKRRCCEAGDSIAETECREVNNNMLRLYMKDFSKDALKSKFADVIGAIVIRNHFVSLGALVDALWSAGNWVEVVE